MPSPSRLAGPVEFPASSLIRTRLKSLASPSRWAWQKRQFRSNQPASTTEFFRRTNEPRARFVLCMASDFGRSQRPIVTHTLQPVGQKSTPVRCVFAEILLMNERSRCCFLSEPLEPRVLLAGEPWGAFPKLIKQDAAISHYPSINGAGESVAIIDSGVDYMHPALGGGFGPGFKVVAGYDFVDNDSDPMDPDGHGTGIAGIIAGTDFFSHGSRYTGLA